MSENTNLSATPAVLVTGASTGIGAVYAQRFARRGHDLVLVARNVERMEALAATLRAEHGVAVDILPADLSNPVQRAAVETRLREDTQIGILVNNAGASLPGTFLDQPADDIERLIALNVTAPTRLAHAIAPRLAAQGSGAIINVGSVVGLAPEFGMAAYGATKSFILHLSQALNLQLGAQGVHVQAVLPAATRTEIWGHSGIDVETVQGVMEVEDLVDAALAGFDQGEPVTIPPLHDGAQWDGFEAARQTMAPGFAQSQPAPRYRQTA